MGAPMGGSRGSAALPRGMPAPVLRPQFPVDTLEAMIDKVDQTPSLLKSIDQVKFREVQCLLNEVSSSGLHCRRRALLASD